MNKKYITTTLPYLNSLPHVGHCFEFVLADIIARYYRLKLGNENVFFNVGVDEHGQKIYQKALESSFHEGEIQEFCDTEAQKWKEFCSLLKINYDNFYRTTDHSHKANALKFYNEIKQHTFSKEYEGKYCVGCESFITEKEIVNGRCPIHGTELTSTKETNIFFDINKFSPDVKDVLIDKSKSVELRNIIDEKFDLSITRQNVKWGIKTPEGDVFYVWFEALTNYIFAIQYYDDKEYFKEFWENSLIICGKDNLKFQAYILQALLLSNGIPQTKEVLVHGNILDSEGNKMSKSIGNVIDPIEQVNKFGVDAVRYYLFFGLNTFDDSKYSEEHLISTWNSDIVNGLGNIITRTLHLVDIRNINVREYVPDDSFKLYSDRVIGDINQEFEAYRFSLVRTQLNYVLARLNKRFQDERPFEDKPQSPQIIKEIYYELTRIIPFYSIILADHKEKLENAFKENKKVILFDRK